MTDEKLYAVETEALQAFFRERNTSIDVALQAVLNMAVTIMMRRHKIDPMEANRQLATYFEDVGEGPFEVRFW